jgi:hypothetical protein
MRFGDYPREYLLMTSPSPRQELARFLVRLVGTFALACALFADAHGFAQAPPPPGPLPPHARRVYVPFEDFQAILHRDKEGVLLPKREFETLWQEARRNRLDDSPGPRGMVVASASYEARIEDRQLLVTARIVFHQYLPGWRSFPLQLGNLGVESATLGDEPARLGRDDDATLRLFHDETGRHELELKLSTPLAAVGSDQVAAFTVLSGPPRNSRSTSPPRGICCFRNFRWSVPRRSTSPPPIACRSAARPTCG